MGQPANDPGWGAVYRNRIYNYIHAHVHVVSTEGVITEPGCGCGFESFSLVFIEFMYYVCIIFVLCLYHACVLCSYDVCIIFGCVGKHDMS